MKQIKKSKGGESEKMALEKLYDVDHVAMWLGYSTETIFRMCRKKAIPFIPGKKYRFRKSSLDKWLDEKESKPNVAECSQK